MAECRADRRLLRRQEPGVHLPPYGGVPEPLRSQRQGDGDQGDGGQLLVITTLYDFISLLINKIRYAPSLALGEKDCIQQSPGLQPGLPGLFIILRPSPESPHKADNGDPC